MSKTKEDRVKLLLKAAVAAVVTVGIIGAVVLLTEQYPIIKPWVLVFLALVVFYLPIFDH